MSNDLEIWNFLGGMFGTRGVEITAALCGLINVVLIIRRSIWNYPFGFIMVAIYAVVFYQYKLYSDAVLQVFFFVVQIYGLFWWLSGRNTTGEIIVLRSSYRLLLITICAAVVGSLAVGYLMARYTDASLPFWDATIAVLSVTAQTMLARRLLENWYFWITVDIIAINVFLAKDLVPTATLYAVFLLLALSGLFSWRRALRLQQGH